jgi:hypothetical protein
MSHLYYAVGILALIVWVIAFFAFEAGMSVHVLPLMSVVLFMLSLKQNAKEKSVE